MRNLVIGTAGHVDHGKTQLVKALTGISTDRLREEKERGISIELGFAFYDLPGGQRLGIVDVPGHEKFIKNMLAGVGGIDLVILVIAADEGIMPQTKEHLDIIRLMQIEHGVVAITKVDLVDEQWLAMIRDEIKDLLKDTSLENSPLVDVSSITGQGIETLKAALEKEALKIEVRPNKGVFRLPVDRIFTMPGFGTVVTGTIISGSVKIGDSIETMPLGLKSKVRNIHVHGEKRDQAIAGQRVALNISSLETGQIARGAVVSTPGSIIPSYRLDVSLYLLDSAKELKNRSRVRIYLGTSEIFGRVRLLDREELKPGQTAYVQLELENQAMALRGDRFVIRSYSPMRTIGGGSVISNDSVKYRRYREDILESFLIKEEGDPEKIILQLLEGNTAIFEYKTISKKTGIEEQRIGEIIQTLEQKGKIIRVDGEGFEGYLSKETYGGWVSIIITALEGYHFKYPLREGYPKEELRSRSFEDLSSRQFQLILKLVMEDGLITITEKSIAKSDFIPGQLPEIEKRVAIIEKIFLEKDLQPPIWQEAFKNSGFDQEMSEEVLHYLIKKNILTRIAPELYFHSLTLKTIQEKLQAFLEQNMEITVAKFRDMFATSRKYALPLLEYFDQIRITRREGDVRLLEERQKNLRRNNN